MTLKGKTILITCGPTWVPVDDMRVISNKSSGQMGQALARAAHRRGMRVTLLEGPVTAPLRSAAIRVRRFQYYTELADLLSEELARGYDVVIHAAAVADYCLKRVFTRKIASGQPGLVLDLRPTRKLIMGIKTLAPQSLLVGFKLESTADTGRLIRQARPLFERAGCDLVVANSLAEGYQGLILARDRPGQVVAEAHSRTQLVTQLMRTLGQRL